jgi:hypothetical protein
LTRNLPETSQRTRYEVSKKWVFVLCPTVRSVMEEMHEAFCAADLGTFAIPNLFVVEGSVCPTQGSANPALTKTALAAWAADYLVQPGSVL